MLLLMSFLNEPSDNESLRAYQHDGWGKAKGGETCVIELSGLAAKSSKVHMDRRQFLEERIEIIRERIRTHKPKLVVMSGQSEKKHWGGIAGCELLPDVIMKRGATLFVFTSHPVAFGPKDSDWRELGQRLRESRLQDGDRDVN
jgi:hypothetical protein